MFLDDLFGGLGRGIGQIANAGGQVLGGVINPLGQAIDGTTQSIVNPLFQAGKSLLNPLGMPATGFARGLGLPEDVAQRMGTASLLGAGLMGLGAPRGKFLPYAAAGYFAQPLIARVLQAMGGGKPLI